MKKYIVISIAFVSLMGCSSMNPLSLLTKKPSIEANVQLAKNAEQEHNTLKVESGNTNNKQEADTISNDTLTKANVINQISNELTWWQMLAIIICAGVALPSWKELYSGIKIVISETVGGFIVTPLKGIANFLLALLGRDPIGSPQVTKERIEPKI